MSYGRYTNQFPKLLESNMAFADGYVNCSLDGYGGVTSSTIPFHTVTWQSTGLYKVVASRKFPSIRSITVLPVLVTTTDITVNIRQSGSSLTNTDTFYIQFKTGASAANLPQGAGFFLNIVYKDSKLPKGS